MGWKVWNSFTQKRSQVIRLLYFLEIGHRESWDSRNRPSNISQADEACWGRNVLTQNSVPRAEYLGYAIRIHVTFEPEIRNILNIWKAFGLWQKTSIHQRALNFYDYFDVTAFVETMKLWLWVTGPFRFSDVWKHITHRPFSLISMSYILYYVIA